jgi:hypothetical protein
MNERMVVTLYVFPCDVRYIILPNIPVGVPSIVPRSTWKPTETQAKKCLTEHVKKQMLTTRNDPAGWEFMKYASFVQPWRVVITLCQSH